MMATLQGVIEALLLICYFSMRTRNAMRGAAGSGLGQSIPGGPCALQWLSHVVSGTGVPVRFTR